MFAKIKLKNSTFLFIGILIIIVGIFIGSFEYLKSKKDKAFSKMNILLYESEIPENIESNETTDEVENNQPETPEEPQPTPEEPKKNITYNYIGTIEIPKLNLKRGFLSLDSKYNNVNYNITVINGSTFPDQENNNLILAAHSGNCSVCYFNTLYKLELGDIAYLDYAGTKYTYKIVNIYEVEKTGKVTIYRNYNISTLTLITCTRNSDTKQTVYILELE